MKNTLILKFLILLAVCVVGCGRKDVLSIGKADKLVLNRDEIDKTKTLVTLVEASPPPQFNGNPYSGTGLSWSIQPLMFDFLCDYSPFPRKVFKPSLLESYEKEGKVYTLKLKSGLKWSDGSTLDMDDIVVYFYMLVGRSQIWTYLERFEVLDSLTMKIYFLSDSDLIDNLLFHFSFPVVAVPEIYGKWALKYKELVETEREIDTVTGYYKWSLEYAEKKTEIDKEVAEYLPDPTSTIVSGPYKIENTTTSDIIFVPNEHYRIDLDIRRVKGLRPSSTQAFTTAILQGDYSIENGGIAPDLSTEIDKKFAGTMRKVFIPELSQIGFGFNHNIYPLTIPEVRKAIMLATDREALVSVAEPGSFLSDTKSTGMLPSLMEQYVNKEFYDKLPDYSYNPDEAEKLLLSIGWKRDNNGKWLDVKGETPRIEIATINSWSSFIMPSEAMATMLSEFGFNIDFQPKESGVIWTYLSSGEQMIGCIFLGGASAYSHPWEIYNNIYNSAASPRVGLPLLPADEERILKAPSSGKEYNIRTLLLELFAADYERSKEITQDFMTLTSDMALYMPVIEKTAPLRIHDTKLSLADGKLNEIQKSYEYYGTMNIMIAKLLRDKELYFIK